MKKISYIIIFLLIISTNTYAIQSEAFQKIITMINVPDTNVDGYEINEEIYNKYKIIVYGSPTDVTKNQRWKDVQDGKWINKETGKRGEYRILGYSLTGTAVNNEVFPDDYTGNTSPEDWNYIVIEDALSSWNDTEKYQTKKQYEYMLNQKLNRYGVTYDLTASSIGLNKARLEAYATWKTAGSIFTKKKDSNGKIWEATFNVPPIASDADLVSKLNFENGETYKFSPEQEILEIPFSFGADVINLGEFAQKEDIKSLSSEIEINNNIYDKVESEATTSVLKDNKLVLKKSDYPNVDKITISVKNTSMLQTYFQSEVPMIDIKETSLIIYFNEIEEEKYIAVRNVNKQTNEEIPRPIISSINLYRKTISNLDKKIELNIAKKTNEKFICAGQILIIEAVVRNNPNNVSFAIEGDSKIQSLDDLTKRFVYEEPRERKEKMMFSTLDELKRSYKLPRSMKYQEGVYKTEYIIPYGTKQTIHSWNTLREINDNALNIDTNKLFTRITTPYTIKIKASNEGGITTRSIKLDVFERWDTIYNRNISEYIK